MGLSAKAFSTITLLSIILVFALTPSCRINKEHRHNDLFKISALNDSLHLFLQGAEDIPEANYPTVIYVFAYRYKGIPNVEFQSFPGYEMYIPLDTTMVHIRTGKYHGKYIKVYSSPAMKRIFNKKSIQNLSLNNEEQNTLDSKPFDLGEGQSYYRRWKWYKIMSSDIVEIPL